MLYMSYFTIEKTFLLPFFNLSLEERQKLDVFLDGTKFEANANKFKFVWKPTTFHTKLNTKIKDLRSNYVQLPNSKNSFISKEIGEYLNLLIEETKARGIDLSTVKF